MKYKVTSPYGERILNGKREMHKGIDIVFLDNNNVTVFARGIVGASTIILDRSNKTWEWGNYIRIDGEGGLRYYYCHLEQRLIDVGTRVEEGDIIGIMGNTGNSLGIHTHLEIRNKEGQSLEPSMVIKQLVNEKGEYEYYFTDEVTTVKIDPNAPASWAKVSWDKAISSQILDGTRPKDPVTRQELAIVLDRLGLL